MTQAEIEKTLIAHGWEKHLEKWVHPNVREIFEQEGIPCFGDDYRLHLMGEYAAFEMCKKYHMANQARATTI